MNALTICNSAIRQLDGLYSLNDLHKAAGGESKHQPALFMRNDQTQALIAELNSTDSQSFKATTGRKGGTYACRELVIAYAAWISATFHLKVIRVFLASVDSAPQPIALPHYINPEQAGEIRALLEGRFPDGNDRPYAWGRFSNHFRLSRGDKQASYLNLPASKFDEACDYIKAMPKRAAVAFPEHRKDRQCYSSPEAFKSMAVRWATGNGFDNFEFAFNGENEFEEYKEMTMWIDRNDMKEISLAWARLIETVKTAKVVCLCRM